MKQLLMGAAVALTMVACKTEKKETVTAKDVDTTKVEQTTVKGTEIAVNTTESSVWYQGTAKYIEKSHDGHVPMKKGSFIINEGKLVGGEFVMDMANMTNDDLSGKAQANFLTHMKDADFFDVTKYPFAKFKILSVDGDQLTGALTIKNTTKEITVPATIQVEGEKVSIESAFNFDRTDFGMVYNSEGKSDQKLKDRFLKDEVEVKVSAKS